MNQDFTGVSKEQVSVIEAVLRQNLTYLDYSALIELAEAVSLVEKQGIEGALVEAGCALGGSALAMASVKNPARPFYVYDTFGMIPAPSLHDGEDVHRRYETIVAGKSTGIGGEKYYGYEDKLLDKVEQRFREFGLDTGKNEIHLVPGTYDRSLALSRPVALAHIDCDWYESVAVCLERIEPVLVSGGRLVIDDYYAWSGCQKAVDSYFRNRAGEFEFINQSRLTIVKK